MNSDTRPLIGFVGQGFIGKNYADDFERRGYEVVRYALEEPYRGNKEKIQECEMVFVAVPTPTTADGFDSSIVENALTPIAEGTTVVVKSTLKPGITKQLQEQFPHIYLLHSPEFLSEKTAAYDAAHPTRNIVGIPVSTEVYIQKAQEVLSVLPHAPYERVMDSTEAELVKYAGNAFLYFKIVFANLMYDLSQSLDADWVMVREALGADPRIGPSHLNAVDTSGHGGAMPGRGAGGHCLIKDFASLRMLYEKMHPEDTLGIQALRAIESKNTELLRASHKDVDLLEGVYGASI